MIIEDLVYQITKVGIFLGDPPSAVRGVLLIVLWVDARGRVTNVEVDPPIQDKSYLEEFLKSMYQWVFYPARMADGRPVEGELVVTHRP